MGLVIRPSSIHRIGCFTNLAIRKGTRIIEYTGERITNEEADHRYKNRDDTYLFGLSNGKLVIDGDGKAAFINHSCDPNCESIEMRGRVWIVALRDIRPGEELTYEYNLYDGDGKAPCGCGASTCRGSLYSEEEISSKSKLGGGNTKRGTLQKRKPAVGRH